MSGIALRILIYAIVAGVIYWGVRSIIKDWKAKFSSEDKQKLQRDRAEAQRTDIVPLERGEDGVFRPRRPPDGPDRG